MIMKVKESMSIGKGMYDEMRHVKKMLKAGLMKDEKVLVGGELHLLNKKVGRQRGKSLVGVSFTCHCIKW